MRRQLPWNYGYFELRLADILTQAPTLCWTSTMSPEDYLANHSDSMIRIGSPLWKLRGDFHSHFEVSLPNQIEVDFPLVAPDYGRSDYEQRQSTLLWVHSLGHLPQLLSVTQNSTTVTALLESYSTFVDSDVWADLSSQMTSLDHAVAMRIRSVCMLAAQFTIMGRPLPKAVESILRHDLSWAGDVGNYVQNNHGMMLAAAVLHVRYMFPAIVSQEEELLAEAQLQKIVLNAFDSQWICRENTASYQAFYINFCKEVLKFANAAGRSTRFASTLSDMIELAANTLRTLILPNGDYPAMGDSGSSPSGYVSTDGVLLTEDSGLFVDKHDGIYRTFKCGYSSHVHKHADDTSLTLSIDADELILDGGLHSYDWKNPFTRAVKSQRGHSGVFFPKFDDLYPGTLYNPSDSRVASTLKRLGATPAVAELSGESLIDGSHFVRRTATFGEGSIAVQDCYSTHDGSNDLAVQRFLLPANAEMTMTQGEIRIDTSKSWMTIQFDPLREASIRTGTTEPIPYGWISRSWGQKTPCVSVDIAPRNGWKTMNALIQYGRVASPT